MRYDRLPLDLLQSPTGWEILLVMCFVAYGIGYVIWTVLRELYPPVGMWIGKRIGMADAGQSAAVRAYAVRLASKRRATRLRAVTRLADLNDPTAVPALLKCVSRYRGDGPFLEAVVGTLGKLGDDRALPALRELSRGRHLSLMREARAAIEAIEPKSRLLRAAAASPDAGDRLLRPCRSESTSSEQLLRPSAD
jgi:HEAT repeat protein